MPDQPGRFLTSPAAASSATAAPSDLTTGAPTDAPDLSPVIPTAPPSSLAAPLYRLAAGLTLAVLLAGGLITLILRAAVDRVPLERALQLQVRGAEDVLLILVALAVIFGLIYANLYRSRPRGNPGLATPDGPGRLPLVFTLAVTGLALALPLLGLVTYGLAESARLRHDERAQEVQEVARLAAQRVDLRLSQGWGLLSRLAGQGVSADLCQPEREEWLRQLTPFGHLQFRDTRGEPLCAVRNVRVLPADSTYRERLAQARPFSYAGPALGARAALVQPIVTSAGTVAGAAELDVDVQILAELAAQTAPAGLQVTLLGAEDGLAAAPTTAPVWRSPAAQRILQNPRLAFSEDLSTMVAAAPLLQGPWRIVVQADNDKRVAARAVYDLPWLLPALALSFLLAHVFAGRFKEGWQNLADALTRLRAGQSATALSEHGAAEPHRATSLFNLYLDEQAEKSARTRDASERLHQVLFQIADWTWTADSSLRLQAIEFSERVDADRRAALQALKGKLLWELDGEVAERATLLALRSAVQDRLPFRAFSVGLTLTEGPPMQSLWNGAPSFDANGAFLGYQGVGRDITETERTRQASRRFEVAFMQTADPVFLVEAEGEGSANQIVCANRAAGTLLDTPETSLIGRPLESFIVADEAGGREEVIEALRRGIALHRRVKVQRRGGGAQTLDLRIDVLLDGRSAARRFVAVLRDLTADVDRTRRVIEAHEELKQAMRQRSHELEVMAKELESFSYTVSHDLRAPLRIVEGFARILVEDYGRLLDTMGHDHLNRIITAAARMNNMINALLDLSRLSSQPIVRERLDLSAMAAEVIDDLRTQAPDRVVKVKIAPDVTTEGDRTLLRIVLDNLIGNAWKYSAKNADAEIEFGLRAVAGVEAYFVQDNGAGFDMRFADRLFGVFQRLHSASDFPGTGVGLATVQRILRRHGGRIWAESEPDQGSVFYFTLWEREAGVEE